MNGIKGNKKTAPSSTWQALRSDTHSVALLRGSLSVQAITGPEGAALVWLTARHYQPQPGVLWGGRAGKV